MVHAEFAVQVQILLSLIMPPTNLHFITGNSNKVVEVQAILGDIVALQTRSLNLVEIQGTIEEITKDKCRRAAAMVRRSVMVDVSNAEACVQRCKGLSLWKIRVCVSTRSVSCRGRTCQSRSWASSEVIEASRAILK